MIQLVLMGKNSKTQISSGIASFTLDKEMYTPYSQLTAAAYGSFSLTQFADVSRVQLLVNGTEMHKYVIKYRQAITSYNEPVCEQG